MYMYVYIPVFKVKLFINDHSLFYNKLTYKPDSLQLGLNIDLVLLAYLQINKLRINIKLI